LDEVKTATKGGQTSPEKKKRKKKAPWKSQKLEKTPMALIPKKGRNPRKVLRRSLYKLKCRAKPHFQRYPLSKAKKMKSNYAIATEVKKA